MRLVAARPVVVAGMLGAAGILTAVLTGQAVSAARQHRAVAERVLHDYASLGADGAAQRLRLALSQRLSAALNAAAALPGAPAPLTARAVRAKLSGAAAELITDSTAFTRIARSDSLGKVLVAAAESLPSFAYLGLRWVGGPRGRALMVYQPLRGSAVSGVALTMPEADARTLLAASIQNISLLPASLTRVAANDSGTGVRVVSSHGELVNLRFDSLTPFRARVPLGPQFGDLAAEVSLGERVAPSLIVGGLPQSRLPFLVVLLVLSVGLTLAAGDQLRRELAVSRLRDDFVSSVSHELRTPLAQIRMFAETLRLGRVRNLSEGDRSIQIIENEARRMEHLVENLLHFSRGERSAFRINAVPTNISNLVNEIASQFAPLAERSESRLELEIERDITTNADPSALRHALLNLLDNAVKYGRRGQTISVRLVARGPGARIEVDDEGAGIVTHERDMIWGRFTRGEAARRTGAAGTGVGLAIVRDIAGLHGGSARVESAPSGGARMIIELPGTTMAT